MKKKEMLELFSVKPEALCGGEGTARKVQPYL